MRYNMILTNNLIWFKNNNFVVECLDGPFNVIDIVIPHQLIYKFTNFWGDSVLVIKEDKYNKPQPIGNNKPIADAILSVITEEYQSFEKINAKLKKLGYVPMIDLKTVYWKYIDILQRNKDWEIKFKS